MFCLIAICKYERFITFFPPSFYLLFEMRAECLWGTRGREVGVGLGTFASRFFSLVLGRGSSFLPFLSDAVASP